MGDGGFDAVEPWSEVELARGGEGGAGNLFGVEAVRAEEWAALSVGESFGGEVVVVA